MWRAMGGFTFAFDDYTNANITQRMDSKEWALATAVIDPVNLGEKLAKIPKYVVVTSDDEFMMFDWTAEYWHRITGEKRLLIVPNAEHGLTTNIYTVLSGMGAFIRSLAHKKVNRPTFTWERDEKDGALTVYVPQNQVQPRWIYLRYAQTLTNKRRDFRYAFLSNENTYPCKWPFVPMPGSSSL